MPVKESVAKLSTQPVVAVGPANSLGGVQTTAVANRKLANAASVVRGEYAPPAMSRLGGRGPELVPPGKPTTYGTSYPRPEHRHRIRFGTAAFILIAGALGSAYAAEVPVNSYYVMRFEWGQSREEIITTYVPRVEAGAGSGGGSGGGSIVVYPSPTSGGGMVSPASSGPPPAGPPPSVAPPAGGAGGGGSASPQPPAATDAAVTPAAAKPAASPAAGPDSARATLGAFGGGAFAACAPDTISAAQADAANVPAAADADAGASPAHFMLETGGHLATIRSVIFTAGSKCLVSAGDDKVIRIWSLAHERSVRVLRGEIDVGAKGTIHALALSPDGTLLVAAGSMDVPDQGGHALRLYDLRSGTLVDLLIGHTDEVRALAFSADGRRLVSGGLDNKAVLWDVAERAPLQVFSGHAAGIVAVGITPDGERVATASIDRTARLWSTADGSMIARLEGHGAPLAALAVRASDDALVTAAQDGGVKLWNGRDGALLRDVTRLDFGPAALVLATAGDLAVVTCGERCGRTFAQVVLNIASGKLAARYGGHDGGVLATAVAPDGIVATAGGRRHEIHLWKLSEAKTEKILKGIGQTISSTGFYNDSRTIAWSYQFANPSPLQRGPMEVSLDLPDEFDAARRAIAIRQGRRRRLRACGGSPGRSVARRRSGGWRRPDDQDCPRPRQHRHHCARPAPRRRRRHSHLRLRAVWRACPGRWRQRCAQRP